NICHNGSAVITYTGNASSSAQFEWDFNDGTVISGTGPGPYEIVWMSSGRHVVSLNVTENGCSADTTFDISVNEQTQPTPICMVGVNSMNHNMIVWNQSNNNLYDSVIIYKQTSQSNVYEKIGSQSANSNSVFIDILSNSAKNSSRYKIAMLDTCSFESSQSDYHKTIHLTINSGIGGSWNLIWNSYEGFEYSTYNIYRGTSENNLLKIAEQASNTFSYTDVTAPVGTVYYQLEVVNPNPCFTSLKSPAISYNSSRSNMVNSNAIFIDDLCFENSEIWPNPAKNRLVIKSDCNLQEIELLIFSLDGKLLIKKQKNELNKEIDISVLNSGIYFIRMQNNTRVLNKKFIKL
ncbi:MAG: T9SS type A sorting domain-containing protein, partial [Bacteroidales bacterium]|nr:T9SS type A sorting domain-containing protein [Bacteroidales bacterium]